MFEEHEWLSDDVLIISKPIPIKIINKYTQYLEHKSQSVDEKEIRNLQLEMKGQ